MFQYHKGWKNEREEGRRKAREQRRQSDNARRARQQARMEKARTVSASVTSQVGEAIKVEATKAKAESNSQIPADPLEFELARLEAKTRGESKVRVWLPTKLVPTLSEPDEDGNRAVTTVEVQNAVLGRVEVKGCENYQYFDRKTKRMVTTQKPMFQRQKEQLSADLLAANAEAKNVRETKLMNLHREKKKEFAEEIRDEKTGAVSKKLYLNDDTLRFFAYGKTVTMTRYTKFDEDLRDAVAKAVETIKSQKAGGNTTTNSAHSAETISAESDGCRADNTVSFDAEGVRLSKTNGGN